MKYKNHNLFTLTIAHSHPISLDVSGSVNAMAIATGGSTAKQMDCGTTSSTSGPGNISVSFNFTFTNIPKVVATAYYGGSGYMFVCYITGVTTTGFTGLIYQLQQSTTSITGAIQTSGVGIQWIAIG